MEMIYRPLEEGAGSQFSAEAFYAKAGGVAHLGCN